MSNNLRHNIASLIRIANIADVNNNFILSNFIDKEIIRLSQTIPNDNQWKNNFLTKMLENFPQYHETPTLINDAASFWIMPDGSMIDLGSASHEISVNRTLSSMDYYEAVEMNKLLEQQGSYRTMGAEYNAIRLFVFYDEDSREYDASISIYSKITPQQQKTIQNFLNEFKITNTIIEERKSNNYKVYQNIDDAVNSQQTESNIVTDYVNTNQNIDFTENLTPNWKTQEKRNLQTNYPGEENNKLRQLYEKSAKSKFKR